MSRKSLKHFGARSSWLAGIAVIVGLLAMSAGLSACGVDPPVASVNGTPVSASALSGALQAVTGNPGYSCILSKEAGVQLSGAGTRTYPISLVDDMIASLVVAHVINQAADTEGIHPSPGILSVVHEEVATSFSPSSPTAGQVCPVTGTQVLAGFPRSYQQMLVTQQADLESLVAREKHLAIGLGALKQDFAANPAAYSSSCFSLIVVSAKAEATKLRGEIASGASFASIANKDSLEASSTPNGGRYPCVVPAQALPGGVAKAVESLSVGQVSQPTGYKGDWILFKLDSRATPVFSDKLASVIRARLLSAKAVTNAAGTLERTLVKRARVEIDPRYGSWRGILGSSLVISPVGPPQRLVPNPKADLGTSPIG